MKLDFAPVELTRANGFGPFFGEDNCEWCGYPGLAEHDEDGNPGQAYIVDDRMFCSQSCAGHYFNSELP